MTIIFQPPLPGTPKPQKTEEFPTTPVRLLAAIDTVGWPGSATNGPKPDATQPSTAGSATGLHRNPGLCKQPDKQGTGMVPFTRAYGTPPSAPSLSGRPAAFRSPVPFNWSLKPEGLGY